VAWTSYHEETLAGKRLIHANAQTDFSERLSYCEMQIVVIVVLFEQNFLRDLHIKYIFLCKSIVLKTLTLPTAKYISVQSALNTKQIKDGTINKENGVFK